MSRVFLDTNFFIYLLEGTAPHLARARRLRQAFSERGDEVLTFTEEAAELFARIRAGGTIKSPDAIQLATAGHAGCDLFLTNDERLTGVRVKGIQFITSFDRAPV